MIRFAVLNFIAMTEKNKCKCGLLSCEAVNAKDGDNRFVLKALPYGEDALEPHISDRTLAYHYGKHLAAYIDNLNKLKAGTPFENLPLHEIAAKATGGLFNNAAQTFNHYFYFEALQGNGEGQPGERTRQLLEESFGSVEQFKEQFTQAGATLFGSGWVWLVLADGKLKIEALANAGTPLTAGEYPVLTMDVWEHAYYLDTQNARAKYIEHFWKVVDWAKVEERIACF